MSAPANLEGENFYGVTLSEKEPLQQFVVAETDKFEMEQKLVIKQICLGAEAKEGEFNVVQVETKVSDKKDLKIPIAVLKVGETRFLRPNLEFPSASVTFKLIQGTGPVYIHGQHIVNETDAEEVYYEEEETGDMDDEAPPQTNGKAK
ncbi:nucleoplasmin-like protein [Eupeodes corollae]|uniref:nucleoplasmin-like protein n=1 Tax=Eupeodes corollae TaxID=290404 RepID=UPI00248FF0EE|nr:nucleoplasmin-like protein [Eupeodes corollae]